MKTQTKTKARSLALAGLTAAVICAVSVWQIPLPFFGAPLTFQVFAVCLSGFILGKRGSFAVLTYIALGAAGFPVFSGFRGGFSVLFGPTGGFIFGFILLSLFCGISTEKKMPLAFLLSISGLIICHLLGTVQFSLISRTGLIKSFLFVSAPYLPKDIALLLLAYFISRPTRKNIHKGQVSNV